MFNAATIRVRTQRRSLARAGVLIVSVATLSCTPLLAGSAPSATAAVVPTATATASGPPASTISVVPTASSGGRPGPTQISWGLDLGSGGAYTLVLAFDEDASTFLITDPQSSFTLEVPIAGSGIFGGNSCVVKMTGDGSGTKLRNVTWRTIDDATYRTFIASASRYRVQTTTGSGLKVTLPLTDGNCRGTP